MPTGLASPDPGPDEDPARSPGEPWHPIESLGDPADWEALLDAEQDPDEPPDPEEEYDDPEGAAVPWDADLGQIEAETGRLAAEDAADIESLARQGELAAVAAVTARAQGRRGPGQPGSARRLPGRSSGPAGGFGSGQCLDLAPGGAALHGIAEKIADAGRLGEAAEDELAGLLSAADRIEASACYLKHAVAAELIRRRPAPGCALEGPARMPEGWDEFAGDEVAWTLAETRHAADAILDLAHDLQVKLPGTRDAFRSGALRRSKAEIIARATALLDPGEARAAETLVLGRAGTLSPGGLRAAIARAVIQVAPDKARQRREAAARDARVERWPEDSGNAALAGRELPPAEVLAADQRISHWARQLKAAGLPGSADELRARAFLDILLDQDSRPARPPGSAADGTAADATAGAGDGSDDGNGGPVPSRGPRPSGPPDRPDPPRPPDSRGRPGPLVRPPGSGAVPAGFAGRNHLTVPLATLLGLAERPGELPGLGPVDPALARDLARASAASPATTWCLTVTDQDGHAIGHGCARPEPAGRTRRTARQGQPRAPGGPALPQGSGPGPPDPTSPEGPRFTFTPAGQPGPPGGYGTWRLATGIPGQRAWLFALDPVAVDACDHRFQAGGHDPGVRLRHLAQIRHAFCTGPMCRRPSARADFEHNTPYEQGGRSCLCNGGPKCRHEHRLKQDPRFTVEQPTPGTFRWTAPSGRSYTTEPTRYPI